MNLSFDFIGTYTEHKIFFDELALSMQAKGHRVGIIANEREKHADASGTRVIDEKQNILNSLGFKPDFIQLWGEIETITNGGLWKAQKMDLEDVLIHFDDDAYNIKLFTGRWVMKVLNSNEISKF